ncbi:hypothetical protein [Streptomyces bohaiensis]|uniref:hypothetical protein n=1 Tax=Streptomyces bohaiensis TaxID=1431344 RepID=UPI003B827C08
MTERTRTDRQQPSLRHRRGRVLRTAAATATVAAVIAACGAADDDRDGGADDVGSSEVGDDGAATGGVVADETPEDPVADGDDPGADDSGSGGLQACDADRLEPAGSGPRSTTTAQPSL